MKKVIAILLILLSVSGLLLYNQWGTYKASLNEKQAVDVDVSIIHTTKGLQVDVSYESFMNGTYQWKAPEMASGLACEVEQTPCRTSNEFVIEEEGGVTLHYMLPPIEFGHLEDWLSVVEGVDVKVDTFSLKITDRVKEGEFAYLGHKSGESRTERITYYEWSASSKPDAPIFYLPSGSQQLIEEDGLHVYSETRNDVASLVTAWSEHDWPQETQLVYIGESPSVPHTRYSIQLASVDPSVARYYWLKDAIGTGEGVQESVVSDVATFLAGQDSDAPSPVLQSLQNNVTDKEKDQWLSVLLAEEEQPPVEKLTNSLEKVKGMETSYFTKVIKEPTIPLYFTEVRTLHIGEQVLEGVNVLKHRFLTYIPLKEIVASHDISHTFIKEDKQHVLTMNGDTWRLYETKDTYVYNMDGFGVAEDAIIRIEGIPYIKADLLYRLIGLSVTVD
ncbi:hypothetical protein N781_12820 [Pontibacillus halophilus JSM 076056 = DSM 19796]|uniref:Copper amine oxidase-like N-terminal domain-containing protein n=1 Tax=Pontibacillus halophilus JSM 076056 = DSM 19796 TaxID=1385510 RepID=A0A0A5GMV9_9BACI|nr:hypothetical protein [Pontibacillus halophilus]KGX93334.1 hypothetical protein N781_12820 [Pontibacillus halophilus JSM 076056 = DSM 19796]